MKRSIRTMFVLLAVVMSFVAVQAVWAEEYTGKITAISDNTITLDGEITIYCVPIEYLADKCDVILDDSGDVLVTVEAVDRAPSPTKEKLIAIDICVDDTCIPLRDAVTLKPVRECKKNKNK